MADQWNSEKDEPVTGGVDEEIRGVADEDDDEFDSSEDLDEEDDEEEEESSTF